LFLKNKTFGQPNAPDWYLSGIKRYSWSIDSWNIFYREAIPGGMAMAPPKN
jgi:hypothetical protein